MTLANRLTLLRAGLIIPYAALALSGQRLLAGILFAIAAGTDLLDGYVARRRNEETALGKVLDPIADKMLTITALIVLVAMGTLSGWLMAAVIIIAMRELWVAGLREGLIAGGGELPVSALAKAKTAVQLLALFILTLGDVWFGYGLFWAAAALTLITGYQYTVVTFRVLNLGSEETTSAR
ncbi:CDP-diacylglycerol--glycerol-3-phosphate 3-phosphatidyltransferase [Parvularcula sp. ZS-1/3]|uniref:CDP-diacylglycerol--glycerol-3-phosphate 3-phosphatidyltransferase n=1 Tax=Parvularcula mediterranea TaxID=2732508 RepID=A0A7Y3RJ74_9PROT|nr:CDP-alcohol phosphatidyltransferase family protein [Parvularcula mediterranea]NNU15040.1 CDP-diacylglycerol--glycerol-3-phosphate 3-phosphatidyltransferase [Parvularcula mediterranea]